MRQSEEALPQERSGRSWLRRHCELEHGVHRRPWRHSSSWRARAHRGLSKAAARLLLSRMMLLGWSGFPGTAFQPNSEGCPLSTSCLSCVMRTAAFMFLTENISTTCDRTPALAMQTTGAGASCSAAHESWQPASTAGAIARS